MSLLLLFGARTGRILTSGWESGTITGEGAVGFGSAAIDSTIFWSGAKSLKTVDNGNSYIEFQSLGTADGETVYARTFFRVSAIPSSASMGIAEFDTAGDSTQARVMMLAGGKLALFAPPSVGGANAQIGITPNALSANTWYVLEFAQRVNVSGTDYTEARLNGVSFVSSTGVDRWNSVANRLLLGAYSGASGISTFYDDVAVNNSRGTFENSWPGGSTTTTVASVRALPYTVRSLTTISRALPYTARKLVTSSRAIPYTIRSLATVLRRLPYGIAGKVTIVRALPYTVRSLTTVLRRLAYTVRNSANIQRRAPYTVRSLVTVLRRTLYTMIGRITILRRLPYIVRLKASVARTLLYRIQAIQIRRRVGETGGREPVLRMTGGTDENFLTGSDPIEPFVGGLLGHGLTSGVVYNDNRITGKRGEDEEVLTGGTEYSHTTGGIDK